MKEMNFLNVMAHATEQMGKKGGVFLTVPGEPANTMTIGWGWIGWCWYRPVFVAVVRPQRHTNPLLKQAGCFTVSVPTKGDLKEQLKTAGTLSGRDVNKFEGHGMTAVPGQKVDAPIVGECGLHFECRTILTEEMHAAGMDPEVLKRWYPENDLHEIFFGEIVACYATDDEFAEAHS